MRFGLPNSGVAAAKKTLAAAKKVWQLANPSLTAAKLLLAAAQFFLTAAKVFGQLPNPRQLPNSGFAEFGRGDQPGDSELAT